MLENITTKYHKINVNLLHCVGIGGRNYRHGYLKTGQIKSNLCICIVMCRYRKYVGFLFFWNLGEPTLKVMVSSPFALHNDSK